MSFIDLNARINTWNEAKQIPYFENVFVQEEHATPGPSTAKWSDYLKKSLLDDVNFHMGVNVNFVRNLYKLSLHLPLLFTSDEAKECLLTKNNKLLHFLTGRTYLHPSMLAVDLDNIVMLKE